MLCLAVSACIVQESRQFGPPSFVSVSSAVQEPGTVLLNCVMSDSRVESCGFLYGESKPLDHRVECRMEGNGFSTAISDITPGVDYTWCAYVRAGESELLSQKGTFNMADPVDVVPIEEDNQYPPADEIWYTTVSGNAVNFRHTNICVEAAVVSNIYQNGRGVLIFSGPVVTFKEWALYKTADLRELVIPSSVIATTYSCFRECQNLRRVVFAPGLEILGDSSVHHNEALEEIILPDTVIAIEKDALSHSYSLRHIDLPPRLERLGQSAFLHCRNLESIVLPETMKAIGIYAFEHDTALRSVTCLAPDPPAGSTEMFDDTSECPIYVPAASVEAYRSAPYWSRYAHRIRAIEE